MENSVFRGNWGARFFLSPNILLWKNVSPPEKMERITQWTCCTHPIDFTFVNVLFYLLCHTSLHFSIPQFLYFWMHFEVSCKHHYILVCKSLIIIQYFLMIFQSSIYIEQNVQILSVHFNASWVLSNPHPCLNIKHNNTPESFLHLGSFLQYIPMKTIPRPLLGFNKDVFGLIFSKVCLSLNKQIKCTWQGKRAASLAGSINVKNS